MWESKLSEGSRGIPRFLTTGDELSSAPSMLRLKLEDLDREDLGKLNRISVLFVLSLRKLCCIHDLKSNRQSVKEWGGCRSEGHGVVRYNRI